MTPAIRRKKNDSRMPLRMPSIDYAIEKAPNEAKGTWLRRRMGIPGDIPLCDQNKAASAFYTRVKLLLQQELNHPYTWYTTNSLAQGMVDRVVVGMKNHDWEKRLARDVLMNICQRHCQNIRRRENEERRQAGELINLGRRKTIRLTDHIDPMDFVATMKALPEDTLPTTLSTRQATLSSLMSQPIPALQSTQIAQSMPLSQLQTELPPISLSRYLPESASPLEIVGSAKRRREKLGLVPFRSISQIGTIQSGKRKQQQSEPRPPGTCYLQTLHLSSLSGLLTLANTIYYSGFPFAG
jgi:hypothetical protein